MSRRQQRGAVNPSGPGPTAADLQEERDRRAEARRFAPAQWRWMNALAAVALILADRSIHLTTPGFRDLFGGSLEARWGERVLLDLPIPTYCTWVTAIVAVGFGLWYLTVGDDGPRKPLLALRAIGRLIARPLAPGLTAGERNAFLNCAVKFVFLPLIVVWWGQNTCHLVTALGNTVANWSTMPWAELYWMHGHWILLWAILTVDVTCFLLGYLLELPRLGNVIRSVEPTPAGWLVTLVCYPTLNTWAGNLLGWYANDLPQVIDQFGRSPATEIATVALGLVTSTLMGIYAWASVALGLKASNLTNRGTVDRGPYRWVRHPAYVSKNLAWIVSGCVPLAGQLATGNLLTALVIALSLASWSYIYHLRALTEERHLLNDPDYQAYQARVRWRYVPGIV